MKRSQLQKKIDSFYNTNPHHILKAKTIFLYDDTETHITVLATHHNNRKALIIDNLLRSECAHYCIDGRLIPYGQRIYSVGRSSFTQRCDAMLITDSKLYLLELKFDINKDSKDKTKWSEFSEAMKQISTYYKFLKLAIPDIFSICRESEIIPFIGIEWHPYLDKKKNTQRRTHMAKFKKETSLKLKYGKSLNLMV